MGKKGSWFSAIKRVFSPHSKEKLVNRPEKKTSREKEEFGKQRHGHSNSFIPLFKEPSSIEKILGEAERDQHIIAFRPPSPPSRPKTPPFVPRRVPSPRVASPRVASPRTVSPTVASPKAYSSTTFQHHSPERPSRYHNVSALIIQAAYRGYMARRSFRALKGLMRLQGVVRGQNVKRQTMNAMKYMQLLVRIQSQIQSRRLQMLESRAPQYKNDEEMESSLSKWNLSQISEAGNSEDWDYSMLTKKEVDTRSQKKVEAVIKRERAMAYAYSNRLWKTSPTSKQTDIRLGGFPWWWNWLEHQLPAETQATENFKLRPQRLAHQRPMSEQKASPRAQSSYQRQQYSGFGSNDVLTPKSTRSTATMPVIQSRTSSSDRNPPQNSPSISKFPTPRARAGYSPFDMALKDTDSLTSCPPFSVPNYMSPTVSAKAKVRSGSNPKERFLSTRSTESNRRVSFPVSPIIGSLKWNKGSTFTKEAAMNTSVDSSVSLSAGIRRKAFKRFV